MPPAMGPIVIAAGIAYLIGAVPFGYLIARLKGVDLFQVGSGNIGATNVGRVLGKRYGILVFLLDFAKGALPVAWLPGAVASFQSGDGSAPSRDILDVAAAVGAFLGHLFPVYLGFRGGKGVATGFGAVSVLVPGPAAVAALVWLATVAASQTVSLGSLVAAVALVAARFVAVPHAFDDDSAVKTGFCIGGAALVLVKHRGNLRRLAAGRENQLRDAPMWNRLSKTVHVVALGTWFGAAFFFNLLSAPVIFQTFKDVVNTAPNDRTAFLPLIPEEELPRLAKETGVKDPKGALANALAGAAVGPLFPRFFALEGVCGVLALITAIGWWRETRRVHRLRVYVLTAALLMVAANVPIAEKLSALRPETYTSQQAKDTFLSWHFVSLGLSILTVVLAGVALALAGSLPADRPAEQPMAPEGLEPTV